MTYKVALEFTPTQVEALVDQLPLQDKIRLTRKLERQTAGKRLSSIFKKIDATRKKHPITEKEIAKEVETVRRQMYAPRSR